MKKNIILIGVIIVIIFIVITVPKNNKKNDIVNTEKENLDNHNNSLILADILNYDNEILITEDNVDNTNKIIERANLATGIYISKSSTELFKNILYNVFGEGYYDIDSNGYLVKIKDTPIQDDITEKINNYISSDQKCIVIHISDSYKGILDNGAILDFMIERTNYVQKFSYNEKIDIAILNSSLLLENNNTDITSKEFYEEFLVNIFN